MLFDDFDVETERAETVVAANHGTHGVLHPAVVEIAFATSQRLDKIAHRVPCGRAKVLRALAVDGRPLLTLADVAGMLDGIFVFRHQVGIDRLTNGRDANFVHRFIV